MSKRILRAMQIMELSAVDNPAQEGATFVLAKRAAPDDDESAMCGCDKPKPNEAGSKCQKCGKPMGKGLTDPPADNANSEDEILKSGEDTMTDAEKLVKAEKDLADEKAKGEKLAKVATLSDVEKAHYEGLVALDETGADKFLDLGKDLRAAEIEKAKNADPIVYTDSEGHEYHKSEAKAASLAKRADDTAKENKALKDAQIVTTFEKRAAEYPHLKGEIVVKVALLRAVDTIADEASRTAVLELLKANDAGLAEAMKTLGTKAGPTQSAPEAALNKMAEDMVTAQGGKITFAKAYDMVATSPEGQKLYKELYEATLPKAAA